MNRDEWNKFVRTFDLDVNVTVKKQVSRQDIILGLLNNNEIAFKSKKGHFVLQIQDSWDVDMIDTLISGPLKEELKEPEITAKTENSEEGK